MKFKFESERMNWLATNRTHDECSGCKNEYIMPPPCGKGHPAGLIACGYKRRMEDALTEAARCNRRRHE